MELRDISYDILSDDTNVKIYLDQVIDDKSKKYQKEIEALASKLFNSSFDEFDKTMNKIQKLQDKVDYVVLFEGMNKDIPREVLDRSWVQNQSIYVENNTVMIPIKKCLRIKDIQYNLTENQALEIDFLGNVCLVITKDEIYVKKWETGDVSIPNIQIWNDDFKDNYPKYEVLEIEFENYTLEEINYIIEEMQRECKYTEEKL